jgi:hypothetical protein
MCLDVRFIANVHAIKISELVESAMRWIMTRPNGVEIVLSVCDEKEPRREME